jgi:hypothetical protein
VIGTGFETHTGILMGLFRVGSGSNQLYPCKPRPRDAGLGFTAVFSEHKTSKILISYSDIPPMVASKQKKTISKKKTSTARVSKANLRLDTRLASTEERDEESSHQGSVIDVDEIDDEEELGNLLMGSKRSTGANQLLDRCLDFAEP